MADRAELTITYGATFTGRKEEITVSGFKNIEDAHSTLADILRRQGYRLPRWFEFWRWKESAPREVVALLRSLEAKEGER